MMIGELRALHIHRTIDCVLFRRILGSSKARGRRNKQEQVKEEPALTSTIVTTCRGLSMADEATLSTVLLRTDAGVFPVDEFNVGVPLPKAGDRVVLSYLPPDRTYPLPEVEGAAVVGSIGKDGVPRELSVFAGELTSQQVTRSVATRGGGGRA